LILDEPTSALDPRHEQHLVGTLLKLRGVRTIILVTHRLESVLHCDKIFVLESGTVAERGSHDELVARDGPYARMWDRTATEQPAF
jgi:ABC-type multidrug transport system fused ATPase/permease subunit